MATVGNPNKSVAQPSSAMANYANNHFASVTDSEDHDDTGGGVNLRDFDEHGNNISALRATPSRTGGAPLHGYGNMNASSTPVSKPTSSSRRDTIAPIGAGRFSEYTPTVDAIDATIEAILKEKAESTAQAGTPKYNARPIQHQAAMTPNGYSHMSATHGMQYGYNQANTMASAFTGGALQYPQAGDSMGYPYGTTPTGWNGTAGAYTTQNSGGYAGAQGMALGANFSRMSISTTPSHVPKKDGNNQITTPYGTSLANPSYHQTEPRNFAPRIGATPVFLPPPPTFNLGGGSATYKPYTNSQTTASDSDPFSTTSSPERAIAPTNSQALTLPMVPEDGQLSLIRHQLAYGPVPMEIRAIRSDQLNKLTEGMVGLPTLDVALNADNFPFIESCSQAEAVSHGVIKIGNIPFGTTRAELIAFLGRNSKILNDNQEPVHIIMERVSSKTQDAYVEFLTLHDAMRAVDRHSTNGQKGRHSRLGERPVEVQLSSQSALMQDLFPLAAGVIWDGSKPLIQAPIDGQPWKTFKGFVTEEEMTMLVKHVEIPQRSPYSKECPQRPYECMISTIKKLPWHMSSHITTRQRYAVYNATIKLLTLLIQALQRETRLHETVINEQLLKRLSTATMLCPGFTVVQKDNIAVVAHLEADRLRLFNQPRYADMWTHLHALCPRPNVPLDVLEWYIAIIREETTRNIFRESVAQRNEIQAKAYNTDLYFGYLWYEMNLPTGKEFDRITLRELARREVAAMERIFRRAFPQKN